MDESLCTETKLKKNAQNNPSHEPHQRKNSVTTALHHRCPPKQNVAFFPILAQIYHTYSLDNIDLAAWLVCNRCSVRAGRLLNWVRYSVLRYLTQVTFGTKVPRKALK